MTASGEDSRSSSGPPIICRPRRRRTPGMSRIRASPAESTTSSIRAAPMSWCWWVLTTSMTPLPLRTPTAPPTRRLTARCLSPNMRCSARWPLKSTEADKKYNTIENNHRGVGNFFLTPLLCCGKLFVPLHGGFFFCAHFFAYSPSEREAKTQQHPEYSGKLEVPI